MLSTEPKQKQETIEWLRPGLLFLESNGSLPLIPFLEAPATEFKMPAVSDV